MKRHILATCALPYANGSIHLGHLLEHIQADIWVRFQRMRGNDVHFICGDDCHGTPVMLRAEKLGVTPEALVAEMQRAHQQDFNAFYIAFDYYGSTHTAMNQTLVQAIYGKLRERGDITTRKIQQAFDVEKQLFLPDRFILGMCPRCHAPEQYGDNCENCGATYSPTELINPVSVITGTTPITRESEHYFFKLSQYQEFLHAWLRSGPVSTPVANKLQEWLEIGLKDWDISRDAPYFGFQIPEAPDKYFYVWLDAPVGYLSIFQTLCAEKKLDFHAFWNPESTAEIYHFIGKDIIYFHALFWPAVLEGAGYRKPTRIVTHSFLTINKQKMSKSRGTFIQAATFAQHIPPEYLRYYFAAKLSHKIEDIDLNLEELSTRINADLIGKFINIASRCAGFIHTYFHGKLAPCLENRALYTEFIAHADDIATQYEQHDYHHAVRLILSLADKANQYLAEHQPWQQIKDASKKDTVHQICSLGINLFYVLMIYLKPILPVTAHRVEAFLQCPELNWSSLLSPLLDHTIQKFTPLLARLEPQQIAALIAQAQAESVA